MSSHTHVTISPAILYWGTPVVLITTSNEDGTSNIAAMSSAWWLGRSCMLGLDASSKTTENLLRTGECVLNLPDDTMAAHVNFLADTTGSNPVSASKQDRNYKFVKDKWTRAGLTPRNADLVQPDLITECPVQMEARMVSVSPLRKDTPDLVGAILAIEVVVTRIHVMEHLRMNAYQNRIDPDKWNPLIMSFQEFYGLKKGKVAASVLGRISEEKYRALTKSSTEHESSQQK